MMTMVEQESYLFTKHELSEEGLDFSTIKNEPIEIENSEQSPGVLTVVKTEPPSFVSNEISYETIVKAKQPIHRKRKKKIRLEQEKLLINRQRKRIKNPERYIDNTAILPQFQGACLSPCLKKLWKDPFNATENKVSAARKKNQLINIIDTWSEACSTNKKVKSTDTVVESGTHRNTPQFISADKTKLTKKKNSYECHHCSYVCAKKHCLERHIRTHTGEKPYKCGQCSYAASDKCALKRHYLTHSGEKHYKCSQCPYATSDNSALKRHQRIHSGEKRYKCTLCSYTSTDSSATRKHMRLHSGTKPYKCLHCDYTATRSHHLKYHTRVRHN